MTAYEPGNSAAHDDDGTPLSPAYEPNDVAGHAAPGRDPDAAAGTPDDAPSESAPQTWSSAGAGPDSAPPFWTPPISHVESPLYHSPDTTWRETTWRDTTSPDTTAPDTTAPDTTAPDTTASGFGPHTPWTTAPTSPTAPVYGPGSEPPSPWSAPEASGHSSSAPLYQPTNVYGAPAGIPYPPAGGVAAAKPRRMRSAILGTAVAAALIGGATGAGTVALENHNNTTTASSVVSNTANTAPTSALTNGTVAAAAKKIMPSVVTIQVTGSSESGTGSGVVVRSDGYILTNDHVVSVAGTGGSITVQTSDGRSAKASIVGTDSTDDLAVIKVGLPDLTAATFAKSSALTVGQSVVAVGAPLDLPATVTSGIVSATNRTVRSGDNDQAVFAAVQTDAAINPGNSGGALVDLNGNVIGINAAIASTGSSGVTVPGQPTTQSGSIGIGFAIPSDEAGRIATELITTGKATHAVLGVEVESSTSATSTGATLRSVVARGSAASAGLAAGDVVTKVDGLPISDGDDLIAAIRAHAVKDKVTITYVRAGATHTAKVTLTSATS